ncbi:MAG: AAA family ATPase, partial [Chloroflexi bacterium]|nr:AAA family ATPase [Chloroflexota bacterium]
MTAIDAAFEILRDSGEPLHYREITSRILSRRLWETAGKTPWKTVYARIREEIRNNPEDSRFAQIAPAVFGLSPGTPSATSLLPIPRTSAQDEPARFLIQVSRDIGYANIMTNGRYENDRWMHKPRDRDHGEVNPGDELIVYCTNSIRNHAMSLAFSVAVNTVSPDKVTFELDGPVWFKVPLKLDEIYRLVNDQRISEEFRNCGKQGFNITRLDATSANTILGLVQGELGANDENGKPIESSREKSPDYTIENIVNDGCFLPQSRLTEILGRLRYKKNLVLQGPPGTGKTWLAKRLSFALIGRRSDSNVRSFQFHPNLSYEDFVRGWRPSPKGVLELADGPFLRTVEDSQKDPSNDYVVVIEEINRGNPAQIFGEMLTLLEADKRCPDEALALSYPRNDTERVHIPPNLYVIGTMNVADRSLALVDFALRRRFAFVDLEPTFGERWRSWVGEQCQIDTTLLGRIEERLQSLNET